MSNDLKEQKDKLFEIISQHGFFREKVILSSGKESDYYVDARCVTLTPEGAFLSAQIILDLAKDKNVDAIGGPTLGADPLVGAVGVVSLQQNNPVNTFIIRKEAKGHGKKKQIEGPPLKRGARVILIDDVATTGKAFLHAINVLQSEGIEPVQAICLVDRQEGAKEAVAEAGYELVSVFTAEDFLK